MALPATPDPELAGYDALDNLSSAYNSSNLTLDFDPIEHPAVQAFFCMLYTTIFVLGVFGNALVCYVVGRNKAMQTVTNFFISNLALSDILLCVLAVPFTPLYSFVGRWVFGRLLCHLVTYAQGTSVYISTLTLTSIAIDRYFVIIYPFQPRMKQSTCLWIIVGIWVFSLLVTLPYGLYMTYKDSTRLCEEDWPSENFRQIYSGVTTVLQFLVPFVVILFCYVRVWLRLSDHARLRPGCKSSRKEEADRERKRRTNRMLIAMVSIFGASWFPINLINLINDIHMSIGNWQYYNLVFFCVHAVAMSSTCYNPLLYAWLNDNFRKEFKQVLPCFDRSSPAGSSGPQTSQTGVGSAPWRPEAACNGGGDAPLRARPAPAAGAGPGPGAGAGEGLGAQDALLPPTRRGRTIHTFPAPSAARAARASSGTCSTSLAAQLRRRPEDSTPSPTTEATWSGAGVYLGDLVTATYCTDDGTVEFHARTTGATGEDAPASPEDCGGRLPC